MKPSQGAPKAGQPPPGQAMDNTGQSAMNQNMPQSTQGAPVAGYPPQGQTMGNTGQPVMNQNMPQYNQGAPVAGYSPQGQAVGYTGNQYTQGYPMDGYPPQTMGYTGQPDMYQTTPQYNQGYPMGGYPPQAMGYTQQPAMQPYATPAPQPPPAQAIDRDGKPIKDNMCLSVLGIVCCLIPGIAALFFAIMTQNSLSNGRIDEARRYSDIARKLACLSIGLGLISFLITGIILLIMGTVAANVAEDMKEKSDKFDKEMDELGKNEKKDIQDQQDKMNQFGNDMQKKMNG